MLPETGRRLETPSPVPPRLKNAGGGPGEESFPLNPCMLISMSISIPANNELAQYSEAC